ncbi:hypothetical protein DIPPA_03578 [Diplonema papillatum]|nr:hypothetical protein DIPPA_03578 [Diplonema papillatum]
MPTDAPPTVSPPTRSPPTDAPIRIVVDTLLTLEIDLRDDVDAENKGTAICSELADGSGITCQYVRACVNVSDCVEKAGTAVVETGRTAAGLAVETWSMLLELTTAVDEDELRTQGQSCGGLTSTAS